VSLLEVGVRRRIVGRIDRGADVVRAVKDAALRWNVVEGEVRAHGRLAWVEIAGGGPGVTERFDGPLDVVSLHGRVSTAGAGPGEAGDVEVTLVVHALAPSPMLPPVLGRLVACAAISIDVVLEPWETQGSVATTPGATRPPEPPRKAGWAKVVEASQKRPEREAMPAPALPPKPGAKSLDLDEPLPEVGDDVLHPQFGRCPVVDSADDKIAIRLQSGRIIQLGASVLRFGEATLEEDRRVFPVEVRARK